MRPAHVRGRMAGGGPATRSCASPQPPEPCDAPRQVALGGCRSSMADAGVVLKKNGDEECKDVRYFVDRHNAPKAGASWMIDEKNMGCWTSGWLRAVPSIKRPPSQPGVAGAPSAKPRNAVRLTSVRPTVRAGPLGASHPINSISVVRGRVECCNWMH